MIDCTQLPVSAEITEPTQKPGCGRKHRQVLVKAGEREDYVDEKIADMIAEMWKTGVDVFWSCQENANGKVEIEFTESDDLENFVNMLVGATDGPDMLTDHIEGDTEDSADSWNFILFWHVEPSDGRTRPFVYWSTHAEFSPSDVPCILHRLRWYNAGGRVEDRIPHFQSL